MPSRRAGGRSSESQPLHLRRVHSQPLFHVIRATPRTQWGWRLRQAARDRAPRLVATYRRWVAPVVARDKRPPRFSRWARRGVALRSEFGTQQISFDRDGVWIRDRSEYEWAYVPGKWLSALGNEFGWDYDPAEIEHARRRLRPGGAYVD